MFTFTSFDLRKLSLPLRAAQIEREQIDYHYTTLYIALVAEMTDCTNDEIPERMIDLRRAVAVTKKNTDTRCLSVLDAVQLAIEQLQDRADHICRNLKPEPTAAELDPSRN